MSATRGVPALAMDGVVQRGDHGSRGPAVLDEVSLEVMAGQVVAVWSPRRSGRTTLLRVAAGFEPPDEGMVRVAGRPLREAARGGLGDQVGMCLKRFSAQQGDTVTDCVAVPLAATRQRWRRSLREAESALERVGGRELRAKRPEDLSTGERVRAGIARALVRAPAVLLVDDPTLGVESVERGPLLHVLRVIAGEGTSVLFTTGSVAELASAERPYWLQGGSLRLGWPPPAGADRPAAGPVG